MDLNGDGKVSPNEVLEFSKGKIKEAASNVKGGIAKMQDQLDKIDEAFNEKAAGIKGTIISELDSDNDGKISRDEIKEYAQKTLKESEIEIKEEIGHIQDVADKVDVSFNAKTDEIKNEIDTNADGKLDIKEINSYIKDKIRGNGESSKA